MQIGGRILDAAQREGFDGTIGTYHTPIDHLWLVEALNSEVMHQIVGVVGGGWQVLQCALPKNKP
jgi:hypothetical protein